MKIVEKLKKYASENKFITGALILAVAGIACRMLGLIFRIPLTNIVGSFGMGLYQMVFPLYALLLIVSSAGFPVAISKMIARNKDDPQYCKRVLYNALFLLGIIGAALTLLLMIFSGGIARLQGNADIGIIYIAIAPSILIVCIISAFRGYFQGKQNMVPTAVSQIIEQVVKVSVGMTLALVLIGTSVEMAVFGAILAVTVSEVVALVYLLITYRLKSRAVAGATKGNKSKGVLDKKLMSEIFRQALPITAMATIFPLILVFDSMVIVNLLKTGGTSGHEATQLFGIQSGIVHTLINLPAVIGVALATATVPALSRLVKQKNVAELCRKSWLSVKMALGIAVIFVVTYMIFAEFIVNLLYHNAFKDNTTHFGVAVTLLRIESIMIVFMLVSQVFTAIMQATDKAKYPLIAIGIGGLAKVIFEVATIGAIGIYAVSIGSIICFAIAAAINLFCVLRFGFKNARMNS